MQICPCRCPQPCHLFTWNLAASVGADAELHGAIQQWPQNRRQIWNTVNVENKMYKNGQ